MFHKNNRVLAYSKKFSGPKKQFYDAVVHVGNLIFKMRMEQNELDDDDRLAIQLGIASQLQQLCENDAAPTKEDLIMAIELNDDSDGHDVVRFLLATNVFTVDELKEVKSHFHNKMRDSKRLANDDVLHEKLILLDNQITLADTKRLATNYR